MASAGRPRTSTNADTEPGATRAASSMACTRQTRQVRGRLSLHVAAYSLHKADVYASVSHPVPI